MSVSYQRRTEFLAPLPLERLRLFCTVDNRTWIEVETTEAVKRTPLFDTHRKLGARLAPFAGFEMPIQYSGIIDEHKAVRSAAGIFDVSHMGEVFVRGPHAAECVQLLVTNDVEKLHDGRAMYTVMCREDGGILDDLLVYRLSGEEYMLVVNAANREKDFEWMVQHNPSKAELVDASDEIALIAVQGPLAIGIVERAFDISLQDLASYYFRRLEHPELAGSGIALVSRTGYTGEPGVELYCDPDKAEWIWDRLMTAGEDEGLRPAGLGARDTLRVEAGFCLYGNDITEETNPLEAGLGWLVKLEKDDFIGKAALEEIKRRGTPRKLVGFVMEDRGIPRAGYSIVTQDGDEIGVATSGTQSPILQTGIGLGYVTNEPRFTTPGAAIFIAVRGRNQRAVVKKPPFHA